MIKHVIVGNSSVFCMLSAIYTIIISNLNTRWYIISNIILSLYCNIFFYCIVIYFKRKEGHTEYHKSSENGWLNTIQIYWKLELSILTWQEPRKDKLNTCSSNITKGWPCLTAKNLVITCVHLIDKVSKWYIMLHHIKLASWF